MKCSRCGIGIGNGYIEEMSIDGICETCYNRINYVKPIEEDLQRACDEEREVWRFPVKPLHMKL